MMFFTFTFKSWSRIHICCYATCRLIY